MGALGEGLKWVSSGGEYDYFLGVWDFIRVCFAG